MDERGRPGDVRRGDGGAELCEPAGGALCGCMIHCFRLRPADATVSGTKVAPLTAVAEPLRMKWPRLAQRDHLLVLDTLVGGQHDAQAVDRIVHVVLEIDVLADRVEQEQL